MKGRYSIMFKIVKSLLKAYYISITFTVDPKLDIKNIK